MSKTVKYWKLTIYGSSNSAEPNVQEIWLDDRPDWSEGFLICYVDGLMRAFSPAVKCYVEEQNP